MSDLHLPKLSISMEEGRISSWLVEEGATVRAGQPVAIVETDKADVEVEAHADGVIHLLASPGDVIPVESTMATIGTALPKASETAHNGGGITAADLVAGPPPAGSFAAVAAGQARPVATAPRVEIPAGDRIVASPSARRRARELGVDLAQVRGRGPGGRIGAADVEEHAETGQSSDAPSATSTPSGRTVAYLRPAVVAALVHGWTTIPHINVGGELDAEGLVAARSATAGNAVRVTYTDLLLLALARALQDVPELAATITPDGSVKRVQRIDLNLAIASPSGVLAPLIVDVTSLGVVGVARERGRLVDAVRSGRVEARDLAPGCCTLSNLGAYPVDFFTPVLSGPQVCTVATGRIAERVVAADGLIGVRHRIWANACLDHRAADGEAGGQLLRALESRLADLARSL